MTNSYRQILRSSAIIGGASVINILVGLVRMKVAAVVLGPIGVGLIGLLQSMMAAASSIAALGLGTVGTRQIAEAVGRDDDAGAATARRSLFWASATLALFGAIVFWALRHMLATRVLNAPAQSGIVGVLAIGVALTVGAGSQGALLRGMRRTADIARVAVWSAIGSTTLGSFVVLLYGDRGVILFVLAAPLTTFFLGHWYVRKLGPVEGPRPRLAELVRSWRKLAVLGTTVMVTGTLVTVGNLVARAVIQRNLGGAALGQFQASWTIAMVYLGFVLTAMATDYYPRMTAVIHDHALAGRLANEQTEIALLMAAPVLLSVLGLAPWVVPLLYSGEFTDTVAILRWQVLGDVLKVMSWPLGIVVLASGRSRALLITESSAVLVFVGCTWWLVPRIGVQGSGVACLVMYAVHLPLTYWQARREIEFRWQRRVLAYFVLSSSLAVGVYLASLLSPLMGALLGVIAAVGIGLHAIGRIGEIAELGGRVARLAEAGRLFMIRMGVRQP